MAIKKPMQGLYDYLQANSGKKVSELMPKITEFCSAVGRSAGANCIRNAKDEVVAILDGYDGRWKVIVGKHAVEFTAKKTATGFNSYSKKGQNAWSQRNALSKAVHDLFMAGVVSGSIQIDESNESQVAAAKALGVKQGQAVKGGTPETVALSEKVKTIKTQVIDLGEGFKTKEEAIAALKSEGLL